MPNWEPAQEVCNSGINNRMGHKLTFQKCSNWLGNDVNDCYNHKPEGTVGWQSCGIGSSPRSGICSPATDAFSCAWGQDCYAMTKKEFSFECFARELSSSVSSIFCCILIIVLMSIRRKRRF